jgi:hypothetical protein
MSEPLFESHAGRKRVRPASWRERSGRSRITNGTAFLPGIDGRNPWVRRCKDLIHTHLVDLGGYDRASAAERSIVRRVAVLSVELENLERRFVLAGSASSEDLDLYQRTAGGLRRLLESVGLQRRPRDITPSPLQYMQQLEQLDRMPRTSTRMRRVSRDGLPHLRPW